MFIQALYLYKGRWPPAIYTSYHTHPCCGNNKWHD